MPRDPKDISATAHQRTQRRIGELDDAKDPIRLRVGAGPAGAEGPEGKEGPEGEKGATGPEGPAGSIENTDWKNSVRAATTANITISTALNPGDVLDEVTLAENDRVLVKNQTTTKENGIWVVKASPSRALDGDAAGELSGGTTVYVEEGAVNAERVFAISTPGSITPGTTSHTWKALFPKIVTGVATIKFSGSGISEIVTVEHGLGTTPLAIGGTVEGGESSQFVSAPRLAAAATATKMEVFMNGAGAYTATFTWRWFVVG